MTTTVVNVRLDSGPFVYIGRKGAGGWKHMLNTPPGEPGWLGNPYRFAADAIDLFRAAFARRLTDPAFRAAVLALRWQKLGCWCAGKDGLTANDPVKCHGQVIAAWLDAQPD